MHIAPSRCFSEKTKTLKFFKQKIQIHYIHAREGILVLHVARSKASHSLPGLPELTENLQCYMEGDFPNRPLQMFSATAKHCNSASQQKRICRNNAREGFSLYMQGGLSCRRFSILH
ncbi:MAG: hypothetical protein HYV28_16895 [Ignavibacteriales bacterium]|nr:hypothetical protein [Ignavibacteriales bacterium]